jgi:hypothetical protein
MLRYLFFAFIREVECEFLGHIPSTNGGWITYSPLVVLNQYPDGTIEKIADDVCENCGHHIIRGVTRLRKGTSITHKKERRPITKLEENI